MVMHKQKEPHDNMLETSQQQSPVIGVQRQLLYSQNNVAVYPDTAITITRVNQTRNLVGNVTKRRVTKVAVRQMNEAVNDFLCQCCQHDNIIVPRNTKHYPAGYRDFELVILVILRGNFFEISA